MPVTSLPKNTSSFLQIYSFIWAAMGTRHVGTWFFQKSSPLNTSFCAGCLIHALLQTHGVAGGVTALFKLDAYRKTVKKLLFACRPEKGMASTLHQFSKQIMIERHSVKGKEVWFKIDPYRVQRANANIIPTEYFTATYYFQEPLTDNETGQVLKDEQGEVKLFESPVAALSFARTQLETVM